MKRILTVAVLLTLAAPAFASPARAWSPRARVELVRVQRELDGLAMRMDPLTRAWMAMEPRVHGLQREIRAIERGIAREAQSEQLTRNETRSSLSRRLRQTQRELEPLLPPWLAIKKALHRYHPAARRILADVRIGSLPHWPRPRPVSGPFHACPLAGPFWFVGTFGAPRGPSRTHAGQDLFAARGTPVLAVADGTVTPVPNSLGGLAVYLDGADGTRWYHAHLSAFARAGRVSAGDVIGYVGSTGNARGLAPHLHFEYRPHGGPAVDPAAELLLACR